MTRRFVMLSIFEKQWEKIGLNDNDLSRLQQQILQDRFRDKEQHRRRFTRRLQYGSDDRCKGDNRLFNVGKKRENGLPFQTRYRYHRPDDKRQGLEKARPFMGRYPGALRGVQLG